MPSPVYPLENLSDTVLFDVFYETGGHVIGLLNARRDQANHNGDVVAEQLVSNEIRDIMTLRSATDPYNREAQVRQTREWQARYDELMSESPA